MPKAIKGTLIQCDPSIKAIILKIDADRHDYIVEDLDDQTLVIKDSQLAGLKARLAEVRVFCYTFFLSVSFSFSFPSVICFFAGGCLGLDFCKNRGGGVGGVSGCVWRN